MTTSDGPFCACLMVQYKPIKNADGTMSERWHCSMSESHEFVRKPRSPQSQAVKVPTWSGIEAAPKDGTEIIAWRADCGVLMIRWGAPDHWLSETGMDRAIAELGDDTDCLGQEDWFSVDVGSEVGYRLEGNEVPTHWMPLPAPPQAPEGT